MKIEGTCLLCKKKSVADLLILKYNHGPRVGNNSLHVSNSKSKYLSMKMPGFSSLSILVSKPLRDNLMR